MSAPGFYVGQTVLHFDSGRVNATPREATVTKVGRVNVTIHVYGREHQFRMDGGHSVRDFGGFIRTPEQHADVQAKTALFERLRREYGMTISAAFTRDIPTEAWVEVEATLDRARDTSSAG